MTKSPRKLVLPSDVDGCHALLKELSVTVDTLQEKNEELEQKNLDLAAELAAVMQHRFRNRSERYIEDPQQLRLDFDDTPDAADAANGLQEAVDEAEAKGDKNEEEVTIPEHKRKRRRRRSKDGSFPAHIPRYEVIAEASDHEKNCEQHGERKQIGYDVVETLEYKPAQLRVRQTKYPKFACPSAPECGVHSPPRPDGLVGSRYDSGVAAQIITGKYGYHQPIYRQQDYFASGGWTASRSTLLNILVAVAGLLRPLIDYFCQTIKGGDLIGTDDTGVTLVLPKEIPKAIEGDEKSERIHDVISKARADGEVSVTAHMWAYRGIEIPLNVFDFTVSRHRDGPDRFLEGYSGTLMADCYTGYQQIDLRTNGEIQRAACVAHARRKALAAVDGHPLEATMLLAKFRQLYDIESQAAVMTVDERQELRQRDAAPIWAELGEWLASESALAERPKSKLGQAITYLRNNWAPLQLYLSDGRLPIDNNETEQLMRQVALGRKNWMFVGSVAAGERAADFLTLVSSAIRNDLDVFAYVKDVIEQLLSGTTDFHSLRPDVWKMSHPDAVRIYRQAEREDRAKRKLAKRAQRQAGKPTK